MRKLTIRRKEQLTGGIIIFLGLAVLVGQIVETKSAFFYDILGSWRHYVDPVQYMIGMLSVNLILVLAAITRYKTDPNPILNTLKWYFAILFLNDFIILVLRLIQQSNIIVYKSGIAGLGKTYLLLGSARGMVDLTLGLAATLVLARGLVVYRPSSLFLPQAIPAPSAHRRTRVITGVVLLQWLCYIPVNFGVFLRSRPLFAWSLGLGQIGQIALAAIIYWIVKEHQRKYNLRFFTYLSRLAGLGLFVAGLMFIYSMGSFDVLQRFPAGEAEMPGGFGQAVFYISRLTYVASNYLMFKAIMSYSDKTGDLL